MYIKKDTHKIKKNTINKHTFILFSKKWLGCLDVAHLTYFIHLISACFYLIICKLHTYCSYWNISPFIIIGLQASDEHSFAKPPIGFLPTLLQTASFICKCQMPFSKPFALDLEWLCCLTISLQSSRWIMLSIQNIVSIPVSVVHVCVSVYQQLL